MAVFPLRPEPNNGRKRFTLKIILSHGDGVLDDVPNHAYPKTEPHGAYEPGNAVGGICVVAAFSFGFGM